MQDTEKRKITAILIAAVAVFSCCLVFFSSDTSEASTEPEVSEHDAVTIDGEEVDAFEYMGIIYAVTDDSESAEKVGVYGTSSASAVGGYYICVNSFEVGEDDEAVTYSVTSVLSAFSGSTVTGDKLILAMSITDYQKDCFTGLGLTGLVVSSEVDDAMMVAAGLSASDYTILDDSATPDYAFNVSAGDINKNVIANYNGGEHESELGFYRITSVFECPFENPGFDIDCYTDASDNEIAEGAQVCVIGGTAYVDGVAYSGSPDVEANWTENEDYLAEFEITIGLPFIEICTITGTYEMWMMYGTVAIIIVIAIIGLAMLGYRTAMARRS